MVIVGAVVSGEVMVQCFGRNSSDCGGGGDGDMMILNVFL